MPFHPNYGPGRSNRRPYEDASNPNSEQFRKLFIGGLSYETTEEGLRTYFGTYGEITDCVVMKNPETKRSRGFGFITFKEATQLDEAQKARPHKIDQREVETKRAMPRDDPLNQKTVTKMFVGGLKDDTTEEMVRETFPGKIETVEMIKDKATNKSRGFCFITFDDADTVDRHVLKKYFDLNGRRVEVKKAVSKDDIGVYGGGRGGFGRGEFQYGGYGMGGGPGGFGGYGPGPNPGRGGYGGGGYGGHGGYSNGSFGNQNWNQGGGHYAQDYYGQQGGWGGGPNYSYGGPMKGGASGYGSGGYGSGGYGGGSNYNRR